MYFIQIKGMRILLHTYVHIHTENVVILVKALKIVQLLKESKIKKESRFFHSFG